MHKINRPIRSSQSVTEEAGTSRSVVIRTTDTAKTKTETLAGYDSSHTYIKSRANVSNRSSDMNMNAPT
jgi:hypothetical protein